MKKLTKLFALLLTLVLVLGTMSSVMADNEPATTEGPKGSVTISNAMAGVTYKLYRVMDINGITADGEKSAFVTNQKWHAIFANDALKNYLTLKDKAQVGTLVSPVQDFGNEATAQQFADALFAIEGAQAVTPDATETITESGNALQEVSAAIHAEYIFVLLGVIAIAVAIMLFFSSRRHPELELDAPAGK